MAKMTHTQTRNTAAIQAARDAVRVAIEHLDVAVVRSRGNRRQELLEAKQELRSSDLYLQAAQGGVQAALDLV